MNNAGRTFRFFDVTAFWTRHRPCRPSMRHSIEGKMISLKQRKLDLYEYEAVMRGTGRDAGHGVLMKAHFEDLLSPGST